MAQVKEEQNKEEAENKTPEKPVSKSKVTPKKKGKKVKKPVDRTLVIVESPTKTRSLSKFLGSDFIIESSKGHLIDLPKSTMGIDIDNDFEPRYITIRGKGETLAALKKAAKRSTKVLLATDPDREGEAISWHLERALSAANNNIKRVEFNEITKDAVLDAIAHPRDIDILRVNSQQARRLLDRLVGYSISPVLQEKLGSRRFSAGRVQSVALKIIVEREKEIEQFKPEEYWEVEAGFEALENGKKKDNTHLFKLVRIGDEKAAIANEQEMNIIKAVCENATFSVTRHKKSERRVKPPAPYITSRLQQEASTRLGFRAGKTMSVAQSLYEGVELDDGTVTGLITYMRTDSTRISDTGLEMARDYIRSNYSEDYLPEKPNVYHTAKQAQDAHEAIRPTDANRTPQSLSHILSKDQFKLYSLIYKRFIASQMTAGVDELVTIEVSSESENKDDAVYLFRISSSAQKFAGFRAVFPSSDSKKTGLPSFEQDQKLKLHSFLPTQKFTQPPPRYTEASLIKVMEESGIGRPATYVPTIGTLDKRAYIERKGRQLKPTKLGKVISDMLIKHFPEILNLEFTAGMEEQLDQVASGDIEWRGMLNEFYHPFAKDVEKAAETMEDLSHLIRIPLGRDCPECGHELFKKLGKNGYFIGCSNFAGGCYYTENIPLGKCPLCGGNVIKKKSKKGRVFYGCEQYGETGCEFTMLTPPAERDCPKCGAIMGQKVKKTGITYTCQNADCAYTMEEQTND